MRQKNTWKMGENTKEKMIKKTVEKWVKSKNINNSVACSACPRRRAT